MKGIFSFTLKELYDNRDGQFIHHDSYTAELDEPKLLYCYANTAVFEIKSSQYGKQTSKGTIATKYKIFVLFEDFYTIGKDKDINFYDSIDYALNFGDVHIRCTCPAQLYWGYAYIGTKLRYLYGIPRENRFPKVRNPDVRGTICKHADKVIQYCLSHKEQLADLFAEYYDRLKDGQSIYAVTTNGNTITIGHKNDDGDVFFDQQVEEEMITKYTEDLKNGPEDEEIIEETEETEGIGSPDDWWENPEENEEL